MKLVLARDPDYPPGRYASGYGIFDLWFEDKFEWSRIFIGWPAKRYTGTPSEVWDEMLRRLEECN